MCTVSRKTQIQIPRSYWTIDLSWGGRVRQIPGVPGLSHSTQLGSRSIDRPYYKKRKKEGRKRWKTPEVDLCSVCAHTALWWKCLVMGPCFMRPKIMLFVKGTLGGVSIIYQELLGELVSDCYLYWLVVTVCLTVDWLVILRQALIL